MTLALTFLILTVSLIALLLAVTIFLQGYLYQQPTEQLPLRAAVAGLAVALFITFWTYVNTRAVGDNKYGTFFDFNATATKDVTEFEAIRRYPNLPKEEQEKTIAFKKQPGTFNFVEVGEDKIYQPSNSTYITIALLLSEAGGKKARFDAEGKATPTNFVYSEERRFKEVGGPRYIDLGNPNMVYTPSTSVVIAALALNFLLFVVWFAVCWPVLRYSMGHALVLAAVFGVIFMVVLMPLLFRLNKPKLPATTPAPVTAALVLTLNHQQS